MDVNIIETFLIDHYDLLLATDKTDIDHVSNIRRQMLSRKKEMLEHEHNEDWYAFNEDDKRSFLYLIKHIESQQYIGTVRLCFANYKTPTSTLPIESDFSAKLPTQYTKDLPAVEVSRFVLLQNLPYHP